jgi:hypothetical protein
MRRDHSWFCAACDEKNIGLVFPVCQLCGNTKSGDGLDGVAALQQSFNRVRHRLQNFLITEGAERDANNGHEDYVVRDRMIELVSNRRDDIMRNEQALRAQEEQERLEEEKRSKMTKSLLLTGDNRGSLGIQFEFSHHGSLKLKSAKSESVKDATAMIDFENTASSRQQKSAATDKLPALGGTSRAPSTGMSGSPSRSFSAGAMGTGAFNASENLTARLEARQQGHKTRKRLKVTFFDCKEMYLFHF